ncbi:hypothetical protein QN277_011948 [Acacia crassicarpa]|uniref:Reverse transcriptase domain-containing protein n=1 Tax=Acacia crassicarpa TaxID=499986 RepID=A0AAE1TE27_9FABA|nr:hypothetical protein QN277_011948 [Acacia crassicarpa]
MSLFQLLYGKYCHLPVELEHKAFWATKLLTFDAKSADEKRLLQLNELDEFRIFAFESASLYKERTKRWHDRRIIPKECHTGKQVLLYNSRLKLFSGKLKSRWSGPFVVKEVTPFGAIAIAPIGSDEAYKVNGQRLKPYHGGDIDRGRTSVALKVEN